jgi:hypothetical protein
MLEALSVSESLLMALTADDVRALLGLDASEDAPDELLEIMDEGQESLERNKTQAVPKDQDFFIVNDLVMFVKEEDWKGQIGVVTLPETANQLNLKTHVMVRYFATDGKAPGKVESSPAKIGIPMLTHVQNIRWVGNLERFGLTWEDLK